ncbi:UDP-N-acetylmuramoyl-tripeptide--D-alanyl-D-alanine ligase [Oceanobacillus salinisoli]|uniref:UDP-N-acetylmuramoyl-tripeptide--D-alanyl-D- alanine ligase n=1 Tax=Oceanobacillus salinisoli TaxID=2678611 RepID=UPI0012E2129E|nr:UDP-N-acetylmuramoyl-tripeptide--D-alanyl-D-alanine ligase [Oceanobacillus salinisoli]
MLWTIKELANWFSDIQGNVDPTVEIQEVNTDSRLKVRNSLFIPLIGENFDGHQFVEQAIENGAVAIFWKKDKELPSSISSDIPVFMVEDTLNALQRLARNYRDEVNPIVIGITGSNGKTTTKDLVASMAMSSYVTHYTNGNFNNHIGLPLTILSMKRNTEVLVLEMGMSNFGEIETLSKIAKPDHAIITNIGESHIEFLGSREGIAKAKMEIVHGLKENGTIIIDGDEDLLRSLHQKPNTVTCGFNDGNDYKIVDAKVTVKETIFKLADDAIYHVPLLGKHHAKNATFAIALGEQLGIKKDQRKQALLSVQRTSMRFELIKGVNDVSIINDAYNASPTSMRAAIEVVKELSGFTDKVLILGDVLELGEHAKQLHQTVAEVVESPITALFTIGEHAKVISQTVNREKANFIKTEHFHSKEELLESLQPYLNNESLLLFKASRGLKFESLVNELTD